MKKRTSVTLIVIATAVLLPLVILLGTLIGSYNRYSRLENLAKAAITDNRNVLDNTRKAIREAAAVSDKEVEALERIITGYADARGPNSAGQGALATLGAVREAVPALTDIATLRNLQNIVTAGRKDWQAAQTRLIDIKREADDAILTFPGNLILPLMGKDEIAITVVTSTETEGNFATGRDEGSWIESDAK